MPDHLTFNITACYAWAPGLDGRNAWRQWAKRGGEIGTAGVPRLPMVPPMLGRRLSSHAKIALHVACGCLDNDLERAANVQSVFASRNGELETTVPILDAITRNEPVSPTAFSLSVHNTAAGFFSLVAKNRLASTALACGRDTFTLGLIAAVAAAERSPDIPLLYVMSDVPVPPIYQEFAEPGEPPLGVALLIDKLGSVRVDCYSSQASNPSRCNEMPALTFLRWFFTDTADVTLMTRGQRWDLLKKSAVPQDTAGASEPPPAAS